eukprot:TRINITY_DN18409_c0_g1_i1.p1 TRINITY_DN18409_c0_g1~~TRINITY_DN18409_c0_g1_i1.p1  ORF type:complete len:250 (+),score=31.37 TRINITY_DN18409_c0_g1_i1:97-846(+)
MHSLDLIKSAIATGTDTQFTKILFRERKLLHRQQSLTEVLQACMVNRKPLFAWWVMEAAGRHVTAANYLELASYSYSLKEAREVVTGFKLDRQVSFSLLKACKNARDPIGAAEVAAEMKKSNIPIEAIHVATIIASQKDFDEVNRLFKEAQQTGCVDSWVFVSYINFCANHVTHPRDIFVTSAEAAWDKASHYRFIRTKQLWNAMQRVYKASKDETAIESFNAIVRQSAGNIRVPAVHKNPPFVISKYA